MNLSHNIHVSEKKHSTKNFCLLKSKLGTINNNFEANISHIEEINARTLNKAA